MLEERVKIINHLGLHARAAAQLMKLSTQFKSDIKLRRVDNNVIADAKSILSILNLAAPKGTYLEIKIVGEDETEALGELCEFFKKGFGENK